MGITYSGFSQTRYDIKRRRVNLLPTDTTESFIYQTKHALIYFGQQDIEDFILNQTKEEGTASMYQLLLDTLRQTKDRILIREDTVYVYILTEECASISVEKWFFVSLCEEGL